MIYDNCRVVSNRNASHRLSLFNFLNLRLSSFSTRVLKIVVLAHLSAADLFRGFSSIVAIFRAEQLVWTLLDSSDLSCGFSFNKPRFLLRSIRKPISLQRTNIHKHCLLLRKRFFPFVSIKIQAGINAFVSGPTIFNNLLRRCRQ